MERHIEWTSPAALWDHVTGPPDAEQRRIFRAPAILRFASDSFMQEFIDLMQVDPHRMHELLAVPESWSQPPSATAAAAAPKGTLMLALTRARTAAVRKLEARRGITGATNVWNAPSDAKPLKLFQPAHQRYYLVTASLVCRSLGLPDRSLDTARQERVSFVIRLLRPRIAATVINPDPNDCDELAFVSGAWQRVVDPSQLTAGEELNPLSPLMYVETDGRRRRLFSGFVPVGKRETLVGSKQPAPAQGATQLPAQFDSRQMLLKSQVLGPWSNIEDIADRATKTFVPAPGSAPPDDWTKLQIVTRANEQIQTVAWYLLLDFRKWLAAYLPAVSDAIASGSNASLSPNELAVFTMLGNLAWQGVPLRNALRDILGFETKLEQVKSVYRAATAADWPSLQFRFIDATLSGKTGLVGTDLRTNVETQIMAALPTQIPTTLPDRLAATARAIPQGSPWFTIRCVFERPNCAALSPPLVSDPSAAFQLAPFFDPDAPSRPIRIGMPVDTTPAGLRKFD
ncbi:MAG TPA: hypothetical protein VNN08_06300, partial [Thermoanaerobaculia bacterium]|nr:hypothetical protein [Thermoanaerobaculia bacterium]